MSALVKLYLTLYNGLWVLVLAVRAASVDGPGAVYSSTAGVLFAAQSAAVLEVAHAFLGLVRSPWLVTALQVFSRYGVLWGVLYRVPETRAASWSLGSLPLAPELGGGRLALSLGVPSMVLAWGVTEVTRYSFYFFKELGHVPAALTWLRYSGFVVLYPTGVASELAVVFLGLPYIRARGLYSCAMPNALNFAFDADDLLRFIVVGYLVGLPLLYNYMLRQRRKVFATAKAKLS